MSNYLPEDILQEIFLRLPGKSLIRFRCVSKSVCILIDNPSFYCMHHELSNIVRNPSIMFRDTIRKENYTIDYKSVSSLLPLPTPSTTTKCEFINHIMNYPSIFQDDDIEFFSSCNGLVWLSRRIISSKPEEFYIWNPSTNVYKYIPIAREIDEDDICTHGFFYDYKTDDYKLVMVVEDRALNCLDVDVYTLRSNLWTTTSIQGYRFYSKDVYGVLFNGGLHCLARSCSRKDSTVLVCFDISSETFQEVALLEVPMPYPEEPLENDMFDIDLGVVGGCLCLVFHVCNVRVDVWMMQEYGVRESWTKSLSITQECITSSKYLELIWSFKNKETLWEVDRGLVLYDPNNKIYRELTLDSIYYERPTVARNYIATSVSV